MSCIETISHIKQMNAILGLTRVDCLSEIMIKEVPFVIF